MASAGRLPATAWLVCLAPIAWATAATEAAALDAAPMLERLDEIGPAISACWTPPAGLSKLEEVGVTAIFSLRRDGTVIGVPRVTFTSAAVAVRARELLTGSALEAISACAPLRISAGLGQAIAGRLLSIRFVHKGPQGRGT